MSSSVLSDTKIIRGETEYLCVCKTRTENVLNFFKKDRSSKFIGEVTLKKYVV
jgi:hypothetical protein